MKTDNLKIVALEADNFTKLKAIRIVPTGPVVEIAGENAQGKSSVLNVIWTTLGGKDVSPSVPIRKGETEARAFLDLGDIKVTRRWWFKAGTEEVVTDLRVESADGARYGKPQDILNALVGRMTFDPLEFTRWKPEEQYKALRAFVPDFDFEKAEALNRGAYADRTDINRETKRLEAEAAGIAVPADLPDAVDVAALEARLGEAATHNAEIATRKGNREAAAQRVTDGRETAKRLRDEAAALIARAEEAEGAAQALQDQIDKAEALPEPIDVTAIQVALVAARGVAEILSKATRKAELLKAAEASQAKADKLTAEMGARKVAAEKAVASAKMPVEGIGFGEGEVLLNGLPFAQASKGEKLRASMAIASALSPRLRVLRVEEGAFLDAHAREMVEAFARENDMQIWVEVVGQGSANAIVIEDGGIRGAVSVETEADAEEGIG